MVAEAGFEVVRDDPPPRNSDLRIRRRLPPSGQNGCAFIDMAAAVLSLPPDGPDRKRLSAIEGGDEWDEAFVTQILRQNDDAIALYDRGMARPTLWLDAVPVGLIALHDRIKTWVLMCHLGELRCVRLYRTGHRDEAIGEAMKMIEFGRRIEDAGADTSSCGGGWIIIGEGLNMLRYVTLGSPMGAERLSQLVQKLGDCEVNSDHVADAARVQYHMACRYIDCLPQGSRVDVIYPFPAGLCQLAAQVYRFRPNRTKNMVAEACRACIQTASQTYADSVPTQKWYADKIDTIGKHPPLFWGMPGPNATGKEVFAGCAPVLKLLAEFKCQTNVEVRGTRLLLAIRWFEVVHGRLPERLDDLVPEYLDRVPLDDFDGAPLRWSKEKRIVYSVGMNLVDDEGDETKTANGNPKDIVLHLDPEDTKKAAKEPPVESK
jgi:hypothetical protein